MATRIAHLSDLHFPADNAGQVTQLMRSVAEMVPDVVVITGDLTRSGKKSEFREAKAFVEALCLPTLVLPGNHDIPIPGLWARLTVPFKRFGRYFSGRTDCLETADVLIVGLNTGVGWQPGFDWSLGRVMPKRLAAARVTLSMRRGKRLGIVACHHPLHQHPEDPVRSRTARGAAGFEQLCLAGMDLLIHGHLHRSDSRCFVCPGGPRTVCEVCANTALANRERAGPAGYNIIDVENRRWTLTVIDWNGAGYQPRSADQTKDISF